MFANFFVWGAWLTTLGPYMETRGMGASLSNALVLHWAGALVSPFLVGMIADRFFPTEKVLGVLHLVGGCILLSIPFFASMSTEAWNAKLALAQATSEQAVAELSSSALIFEHLPFLLAIFAHMICYMPTINLTTSLSFQNLSSSETQFPFVRVFGTIGWIVAGFSVSGFGFDGQNGIFTLAGIVAIALGVYSFTLPHTPAPSRGKRVSVRDVLGLDALVLLKDRSYLVFAVSSFLLCIPLSVYYGYLGIYLDDLGQKSAAATQSVGQISEIFFMVAMPLFFARLGVKWMLAVGMLAWVGRYALFAIGSEEMFWPMWIGIALHGICYDFFFVTGYIYTDQQAPKHIRSQAQGFLIWITFGWGMVIGSFVSGYLFADLMAKTDGRLPLWHQNWWFLAGFAAVVLIFFVALFRPNASLTKDSEEVA